MYDDLVSKLATVTTTKPVVSSKIWRKPTPFKDRLVYRDEELGRVFWFHPPIDDLVHYPIASGADCFRVSFPYDLGSDVATSPTQVFDLRNDCGTPTTIDLL